MGKKLCSIPVHSLPVRNFAQTWRVCVWMLFLLCSSVHRAHSPFRSSQQNTRPCAADKLLRRFSLFSSFLMRLSRRRNGCAPNRWIINKLGTSVCDMASYKVRSNIICWSDGQSGYTKTHYIYTSTTIRAAGALSAACPKCVALP